MGVHYIYFVSYHAIDAKGNGFGNAEVEITVRIRGADDINRIAEDLKEKNNWDGVVILNYQLMREEFRKPVDKDE